MKSAHITTYICAIVIAYVRMQEHIHLTAFNNSFVTPSLMNSTIVHWNVLFYQQNLSNCLNSNALGRMHNAVNAFSFLNFQENIENSSFLWRFCVEKDNNDHLSQFLPNFFLAGKPDFLRCSFSFALLGIAHREISMSFY